MKKRLLLSLVAVFMVALSVNAQEFKKFRVGTGLGFAKPGGDGAKGGVLVYMEPGYRVSDQLLVGLRLESAIVARGFSGELDETGSFDIAGIGSYTVNGQYYFNNNGFRPFVGLGLGLYSLSAVSVTFDGQEADLGKKESKLGFYPRLGFDAGHFTMQLEYNLIPATKVDDLDGEFKNSYLSIKIGAFFGGGRK